LTEQTLNIKLSDHKILSIKGSNRSQKTRQWTLINHRDSLSRRTFPWHFPLCDNWMQNVCAVICSLRFTLAGQGRCGL